MGYPIAAITALSLRITGLNNTMTDTHLFNVTYCNILKQHDFRMISQYYALPVKIYSIIPG